MFRGRRAGKLNSGPQLSLGRKFWLYFRNLLLFIIHIEIVLQVYVRILCLCVYSDYFISGSQRTEQWVLLSWGFCLSCCFSALDLGLLSPKRVSLAAIMCMQAKPVSEGQMKSEYPVMHPKSQCNACFVVCYILNVFPRWASFWNVEKPSSNYHKKNSC